MVTVEVISDYRDKEKQLLFHKGEKHEVKKERAEELVKSGAAKIVAKPKEAPKDETDKEEK